MTPYATWKQTWGEVGLVHNLDPIREDEIDEGFGWRLTLSTGIDCFNLGIAIRRPRPHDPFGALGIGFLFFLVKLEWYR